MTFDGTKLHRLNRKDRGYVARRISPFPVYSQTGLLLHAYYVKNTRRMRKLAKVRIGT